MRTGRIKPFVNSEMRTVDEDEETREDHQKETNAG